MKLLFASDIHGSLFYAEKVIEAFNREKPDKLILLGDLLYHGPRNPLPEGYDPMGVAALLNKYKSNILAVRGNCDADVDQMVLEFPITQETLSVFAEDRHIFVSHGHLFSLDNPPKLNKNDVLINGHFHVAEMKRTDNFTYMNPGSVSLPKDGKRCYILFENNTFSLKSLSGEIIDSL